MADVARGFEVGETVYVWYHTNIDLQFTPTSRRVSSVDIFNSDNDGIVTFTIGNSVTDAVAVPRVFTTAAACATAIITQVIADTAATVVLETGSNTTLVRTT